MSHPQLEQFDLDEWINLAHSDPDAFERQRKRAINMAIARASQHMQPRLHALQWRIDMERSRASNPLSACVRLSDMMWQRVYGKKGLMDAIGDLTKTTHFPLRSAKVIAFVRR